MPGFSQHARVSGGDTVVAALRQHLMGAVELVEEAVQDAQEDFLARQRDAAEADPQWAPLAKHMGAWEDEDGNFAHGVQGDDQAVIQAGRLEYGDVEHPPQLVHQLGRPGRDHLEDPDPDRRRVEDEADVAVEATHDHAPAWAAEGRGLPGPLRLRSRARPAPRRVHHLHARARR